MSRLIQIILCCTALFAVEAQAQRSSSVLGSDIWLKLQNGLSVQGELIAVDSDSVWMARPQGFSVFPISSLESARVPQSGLTSKQILIWTLIGGGASALGLSVACHSVDGTDCGGIVVGVGASWALVGGLSAVISGPSTRPLAVERSSLSPYARFPQGLPEGFLTTPRHH